MSRLLRRVPSLCALGGALLAVLCMTSLVHADRATAEFLAERGEKSLDKKDWTEAEKFFRKSLTEDKAFLPARFGLANALLGSDQKTLAITEMRLLIAEADANQDLPPSWGSTVKKARKLLAKLDELGSAYNELVNEHAEALVRFAKKWAKKDPAIAAKALQQALALVPKHPQATEALTELGIESLKPGTPLFNGEDLKGWFQMSGPVWTVKDGLLVGQPGEDAFGGRTLEKYSGDFDILMEARMIEKTGRIPHFSLSVMASHREKTSIGFLKDNVVVLEHADSEEKDIVGELEPDEVDPKAWNVYELRLRKNRIHVLVNGKEIHQMPRRSERASGHIGLVVQAMHLEIKRIEFRQQ